MNGQIRALPSMERILELFSYDPETGLFTRKINRGKTRAGEVAGAISCGYIGICIDWVVYRAHRLAWFLHTGEDPGERELDHINGVRTDNRIANLRFADRSKQLCNTAIRSDNTTGVKGVYHDKSRGKYAAEIMKNGKRVRLGRFNTLEEAEAAYKAEAISIHGEYRRA